ncbi:hypothetical protein SDC9_146792 [bioreactor metagenome]|uniref:Uncharacterized protein n=1 Tax=bioreactor metagenome TaxID=1076179 RepID=A0A645ECN2_9ZZZZ
MEGRNVAAQAGQADGERRVGVEHGADFRAGGVEIAVKAPFRRRLAHADVRTVERHERDVIRRQRRVGHAGRRDQKAVAVAHADVARGALVQPGRAHGPGGSDQFEARVSHRLPPGRGRAGLRDWPRRRRVR